MEIDKEESTTKTPKKLIFKQRHENPNLFEKTSPRYNKTSTEDTKTQKIVLKEYFKEFYQIDLQANETVCFSNFFLYFFKYFCTKILF